MKIAIINCTEQAIQIGKKLSKMHDVQYIDFIDKKEPKPTIHSIGNWWCKYSEADVYIIFGRRFLARHLLWIPFEKPIILSLNGMTRTLSPAAESEKFISDFR